MELQLQSRCGLSIVNVCLEEAVAQNVWTQPVDERLYGRIAQVFAAIHRSQPSLAGAPAVGAVRLFGEKPQESKRPPRLLAGLRRLEDDPLDDEQALARFTEGDLDPAQPGPHQIRSGVADQHVS